MSNDRPAQRMLPDARREQIVGVAVEHFARDGYDRASMSRIAADAGVTRGLVYHYFPGKEALLEAALRREASELLESTSLDPGLSPRENLERALGAYLDHFAASTGELRGLYAPHPMTPAVVWEIAAANHEAQVTRLFEGLGLAESPRLRLGLGAWLAFVEQLARESADAQVRREEIIHLGLSALQAITGLSFDDERALPRPGDPTPPAEPIVNEQKETGS